MAVNPLSQIAISVESVQNPDRGWLPPTFLSEVLRAFQSGGGRFFFLSVEKKALKSALFKQVETRVMDTGLSPLLALPPSTRLSPQLTTELVRLKQKVPGFKVCLDEKTLRSQANVASLQRLKGVELEVLLMSARVLPAPAKVKTWGAAGIIAQSPKKISQIQSMTQRYRKAGVMVSWILDGALSSFSDFAQVGGVELWVLGDALLNRSLLNGTASAARQVLAELQAP